MIDDTRAGEARLAEIREMRRDAARPSRRGLMGAGAGAFGWRLGSIARR